METLSIFDDKVAEALYWFLANDETFNAFCEANLERDYSMAEWVFEYRLTTFNEFCKEKYGFLVKKSGDGAQTTA